MLDKKFPKKKKALFMLQLPPPVHGVSTVNRMIIESGYVRENIDFDILPINTAVTLLEIDKVSLRKFLKSFQSTARLIKRLLTNRYDFVYITINVRGWAFFRDIVYVFMLRLFGTKRLYHLHGYGVKKSSKNMLMRRLYRWYFNDAKVITLAKIIYDDMSEYVKEEDSFILHNALPLSLDEMKIKSIIEERKNNELVNILFLSNMVESKGPSVLLKSLKILKDKGYDFKAVFAGGWNKEDYQRAFQKSIIQYGLEDYIELKGFCKEAKKAEVLARADIFAFPTMWDTWALVVLEAMEYALPVISTEEGAIPEIITNGVDGYIVPKNDADSLAEKIEILINDKDLRLKLGNSARQEFIENYSFDIYERELVDIINKI